MVIRLLVVYTEIERVIEANEILSEKQLGNVRKLLVALGYAVSGGVLL